VIIHNFPLIYFILQNNSRFYGFDPALPAALRQATEFTNAVAASAS
jgi:hypothetical protein